MPLSEDEQRRWASVKDVFKDEHGKWRSRSREGEQAPPNARQRRAETVATLRTEGITPGAALEHAPINFRNPLAQKLDELFRRTTSREGMRRQYARGDTQHQLAVVGLENKMALEWVTIADNLEQYIQREGFQKAWETYTQTMADAKGQFSPDEAAFTFLMGEKLVDTLSGQVDILRQEEAHAGDELLDAQAGAIQHEAAARCSFGFRATTETAADLQTLAEDMKAFIEPAPAVIGKAEAKHVLERVRKTRENVDGTADRKEAERIDAVGEKAKACVKSFESGGTDFLEKSNTEQRTVMKDLEASAHEVLSQAQTTLSRYEPIIKKYEAQGLTRDQIDRILADGDEDYKEALQARQIGQRFFNLNTSGGFNVAKMSGEKQAEVIQDLSDVATYFGGRLGEAADQRRQIGETKGINNADVAFRLNGATRILAKEANAATPDVGTVVGIAAAWKDEAAASQKEAAAKAAGILETPKNVAQRITVLREERDAAARKTKAAEAFHARIETPHEKFRDQAEKYGYNPDDIAVVGAVLETARVDQKNLGEALTGLGLAEGEEPAERLTTEKRRQQSEFIDTVKRKEKVLQTLQGEAWEDVEGFVGDLYADLGHYGLNTEDLSPADFATQSKAALEGRMREGGISIFEILAILVSMVEEARQEAQKKAAAQQKAAAQPAKGAAGPAKK